MIRDITAIFTDIGSLALYMSMAHSESMKACQMLGYNGFKRKHRYRAKEFYDLMLSVQNHSIEYTQQNINLTIGDISYSPKTLKEHLEFMVIDFDDKLKKIGVLNSEFVTKTGFECEKAECIKEWILHDLIKFKRWLAKFNACMWNESVVNDIDMHIHAVMKEKE
jgi:hypothetical protein